jgi:hypothetical protein
MAGLTIQPRRAPSTLQLLALALLVVPNATVAAAAAATPGADLAAAVSSASGQLRQAWNTDPSSANLPFPKLRLLPAGASVDGSCTSKAPARRPAPTAAWCANTAELLLDRDLLSAATDKLSESQRQTVVTYWLAMALAERLLPEPATGVAPRAVVTLQANCLGGVLLGASAARPSAAANPLLIAARAAYGDSHRAAVGSASQRGYALLTGLGATATASCSNAAMAALAKNDVPDPALLQQIEQLPPPDRAHSSLMAAISSQCQPLPQRPCPRRVATR